jgi:group II intron reverse transcriptase/maturase
LLRRFKKLKFEYVQCGRIDSIADGIARVYGLDGVQAGELLEFVPKSGVIIRGMALNLEKEFVGAVLFGNDAALKEGDFSRRTKSIISVPTGLFLRGRVLDPLGQPLDGKGSLPATKQELIERKAPGIQLRARIDSPMATGIRAVDSLVPIGNGQRELIIGDRQVGKTAIAVDGRRCAPFVSVRDDIHVECLCSPSQGLADYGLRAEQIHDVSMVRMTNQTISEKAGDSRSPRSRSRIFTSNRTTRSLSIRPSGVVPEVNAWQRACATQTHEGNLEPKDTEPEVNSNLLGRESTNEGTSEVPKVRKLTRGKSGAGVHSPEHTLPEVEGPQLGHVINDATYAFITIRNLKSDEFNSLDLARALAQIEYLGRLAKRTTGHLGKLDIVSILSNPSFLLYSYGAIKKDTSVGIDNVLPTGVTARGLLKLAREIKDGTYKPKPTRRVYIDKPGKAQKRPLGVPCTRDKIVQQSLKMVLEKIFEPTFSDLSFGFRPNRSCHQALEQIEKFWPNTIWLLEFDFSQAFDKINHRILIQQLCKRFNDPKTLQIIWSMLKTGYIYPKNLIDSKLDMDEGTPQGSILSPLMANIYFDPLDKFMEEIMTPIYTKDKNTGRILSQEYLDETQRWTNNEWTPIVEAVAKAVPRVPRRIFKENLRKIRVLEAGKKDIRVHTTPDKYRLTYTRYADDFVIGYIGSKDSAKIILQETLLFCEGILKMGVNPEKTRIRHKTEGSMFLGYRIHLNRNIIEPSSKETRRTRTRMMFSIPLEKLFKRYATKGFLRRSENKNTERYVGRRQDKYCHMQPYDIISRYNSVVRGLINYYRGSERLSVLYNLLYNLRRSAALTIAHHKKRCSAKWAFDNFGKTLKVSKEKLNSKTVSTEFFLPSLTNKGIVRWRDGDINHVTRKKVVGFPAPSTMTLTRTAKELKCAVPECIEQAEHWHHIKHRRKVEGTGIERIHVQASARQIPVCVKHHQTIHSGKYDGPSLKKIKGYEDL